MTRKNMGNLLSANTATRTIAIKKYEGYEVMDSWKVSLMYVENGVLVIECEPPQKRRKKPRKTTKEQETQA